MGWIFVNILLPIIVPMFFMLGSKLVDLSPEAEARAQLLRAVQDGQLGWVSMGFSASCSYDLINYMTDGKPHTAGWPPTVLGVSFGLLALAGFLAALGTLYPVDVTVAAPTSWRARLRHYRMFVGTSLSTALSATLYIVVHYQI